ncbi:phosphoglycerate mutase family protein [Herpetosiphon gulosus]|uniref:Phosphoglycerate mutase n=1 Tax=Herpetosiphon gulosus TaxID=1973496 RepID=A0ABP9WT09_9CHLR
MSHECWLIRHGESLANAGERTPDPASVPLTALGWQQAHELIQRLPKPHRVIVSQYLRTHQTAEPLLKHYPDLQAEVWPIHEFTYLSPSLCRDTNQDDRRPLVEEYWQRCDPDYRHASDAESFRMLIERVQAAMQRLQALDGISCVFAHGQIIRTMLWLQTQTITTLDHAVMRRWNTDGGSRLVGNAECIPLLWE